MKYFIDGDQVVITHDQFIDLQESPAVFIPLDSPDAIALQRGGVLALSISNIAYYQHLLNTGGGESDGVVWDIKPWCEEELEHV